jgi:hypothetical protein
MITCYIDGKACEQLVSVRQAGVPFEDQTGDLVGVDYAEAFGGGMCNVRFTREQAEAIRDALHAFLTQPKAERLKRFTIAKVEDGKLIQEIR